MYAILQNEGLTRLIMRSMYANYHTHSYHCNHASGTPEQYVEAALASGIRILGFSDHVPCDFTTGHRSGFRMEYSRTETYVTEILGLREKYKDQAEIYIGYEAEFYPDEFLNVLNNILQYPCDYLILGQHFTKNEYDGVYVNGNRANNDLVLREYVDQLITAVETGVYSCINHPDILHYDLDEMVYKREMGRLCEAAKFHNIPLEINLHGIDTKRTYPDPRFWQIAGDVGAPVIIGRDAHHPEAFYNTDTLRQGMELVSQFHLKLQETMVLRPVGKGTKA